VKLRRNIQVNRSILIDMKRLFDYFDYEEFLHDYYEDKKRG